MPTYRWSERPLPERDIRPVIPLKLTVNVANGLHKPPTCQHGVWPFAGSDTKRGASKWRCPTGKCQPASVWIKADRLHTFIPRTTDRWKAIYRTWGAVEREFGRLKHEWGLGPLRVRRLPRVRLHVDLRPGAVPWRHSPAPSEPAHGGPFDMPAPRKRAVDHRYPGRSGSHAPNFWQNSR